MLKQLLKTIYRQIDARISLYHLQDSRALQILLNPKLIDAAQIWPKVLPSNWKPKTILDIGAHYGGVANQLSQLYHPRFIGLVEPLPQLAEELQTRTFASQQKIFATAIGRNNGEAELNVLATPAASSLLEVSPSCGTLYNCSMEKLKTIKVPVRTLDSIFKECALEKLDLLKIDVQGYEIEAFASGTFTLSKTHVIVTEVLFFQHYKDAPQFGDIYSFLHEAGFELRGTFGYAFDSKGIPLHCDAVFINHSIPI
ncbi:MAG: FkbM family methyltransferase [Xenococcaceae cyanobacterium]